MKKINLKTILAFTVFALIGSLSFGEGAELVALATVMPLWMVKGSNGKDEFKRLSSEEASKLNDADLLAYKDAYEVYRDEQIKTLESGMASNEEMKAIAEEVNKMQSDLLDTVLRVQKEQGEKLAEMTVKHKVSGEVKTVKQLLEEKSAELKGIKDKSVAFEYTPKASHTSTDIADRDYNAQLIPGIEGLARRSEFVKNWFRVLPANTEYIRQIEQDTVVRDAKNVALCSASTHNTKLTWKQTLLDMKKVRDFTHVCLDMMEDYDFVQGQIEDLISYGVGIKVDEQLLLGDGTGANLSGISSYASTFAANLAGADYSALTGTPIASPTVADLIAVAGAQIRYLGQENKFMPNVAFLNPKQIQLLKMEKDADGNSLSLTYLDNDRMIPTVDGIALVGNPLVPENEAYVMDSTKGVIYERRAKEVSMSFENNDNFETETVTVKGYERLNLWVASNNANAFMHIADISAGITAITKP